MKDVLHFHLSLNVTDLKRSVAFYRILFGAEPSKCHDDYAKFDLDEPPVVFSLVPRRPGAGGSLSHLGLRVADGHALEAMRRRLESAGLSTQCQQGTVCGYARQNKVWIEDPDRNFWEIYEIEAEVDPATLRRSIDGAVTAAPEPTSGPIVWEHYVGQPTPAHLPHPDGSVDEVRLTGSFNGDLDETRLRGLVAEAWRVLKPGGRVVAHGLMGDRPFNGKPALPGLAALVSRVPIQTEPLTFFRAAGFVGLQYVKFTDKPWFVVDGVELREIKVVGRKPEQVDGPAREVLYKGPFRRATDEAGNVYERGRRTTVSATVWEALRNGPAAEQFLFLQGELEAPSGCGCG